jgi:hypothetical protein
MALPSSGGHRGREADLLAEKILDLRQAFPDTPHGR